MKGTKDTKKKGMKPFIFLMLFVFNMQPPRSYIHQGARRRHKVIINFFAFKPSCPS